MSVDQLRQYARQVVQDVWNARDVAAVERYYAPDFKNHNAGPGTDGGREGVRRAVQLSLAAFPDLWIDVDDVVVDGDLVVTRWTMRGTHTGPLWGVPPTGRAVSVTGITMNRIVNGMYAEEWVNQDTLGLLQQLGVLPGASGDTATM